MLCIRKDEIPELEKHISSFCRECESFSYQNCVSTIKLFLDLAKTSNRDVFCISDFDEFLHRLNLERKTMQKMCTTVNKYLNWFRTGKPKTDLIAGRAIDYRKIANAMLKMIEELEKKTKGNAVTLFTESAKKRMYQMAGIKGETTFRTMLARLLAYILKQSGVKPLAVKEWTRKYIIQKSDLEKIKKTLIETFKLEAQAP